MKALGQIGPTPTLATSANSGVHECPICLEVLAVHVAKEAPLTFLGFLA